MEVFPLKNHFTLLLCFLTIIFITNSNTAIFANEKDESSFINSYEEDITGDGFREYFRLEGTLLSEKSNYYRDVWLNISSPFSKQWKISLNGGYDPNIQLIDLNHDHIFDLFYQVAKDEEKKQYQHQLYTLKNGVVEQLELPKHNYIQGEFQKDFTVTIQINPNAKPIKLDVSRNKEKYISEKLYNEDGSLFNRRKLNVNPISFIEPVLISESKGYGLKSYQTIKGIDNEDILGSIETLWYFKNNTWFILKSDWIPK